MTIDFDIVEFCKKLKASKQGPYACPLVECGRSYKTIVGLQYHLGNFDHSNPPPPDSIKEPEAALPQTPKPSSAASTPATTPGSRFGHKRRKKKKAFGKQYPKLKNKLPEKVEVIRETLSLAESKTVVQFQEGIKIHRLGIYEKMPICSKEDFEQEYGQVCTDNRQLVLEALQKSQEAVTKLPEPCFKELENYKQLEIISRPTAYIRFIERNAEELDEEVEYDMDEEDAAWLNIINEQRKSSNLPALSIDTFELLMDRLEKECQFQMSHTQSQDIIDDEAVCCICNDGECQNSNVILFCDMCNLAVHQDCYGVPYIPEGQWLCRRCLHTPSRAVDCVLCPNNGGAFKQTDRGAWAHVVCALWIPEVRFANTVFLEPIDSIEAIPTARWKLTCYVCKQRGVGACIQCHKTNCYAAFHVTCAQQAGLYMNMDTIRDHTGVEPVIVQKLAYCDAHTPPDVEHRPRLPAPSDEKLKNARLVLAKKRVAVPTVSIPTIPPERVQDIAQLISIPKKSQLMNRLIAYWTIKRQLRNGVPLLRRLQSSHQARRDERSKNTSDTPENSNIVELYRELKYWQCLRQDLERARLLCELVRKREKMKREYIKVTEACTMMKLNPFNSFLLQLVESIKARDTGDIFLEPVDTTEVLDYADVIKHPMDLTTMTEKIKAYQYLSVEDFESDFNLMIKNCLTYNEKDTVFYKAGVKMKQIGGALINQAAKTLDEIGFDQRGGAVPDTPLVKDVMPSPGMGHGEDNHAADIDKELADISNPNNNMGVDELMCKLLQILDKAQSLKHATARIKRVRLVNTEITKLRKRMSAMETSEAENKKIEDVKKSEVLPEQNSKEKSFKSPDATPKKKHGNKKKPVQEELSVPETDSFKVYRSGGELKGEAFDSAEEGGEDEEEEDSSCSECSSSCDSSDSESGSSVSGSHTFEQLQLVWAKCRGYPWYPALIINPQMPRGYIHNGVPIPSPPEDVLALANNYTEPVYLVLFFDTKRTWQWLPRNKLEPLGITDELDQVKLMESRKPADRKAVKKAYQEALVHKTPG
uniref:Peregrin n=1 Tax=Cacopsylla melanoneura TaxID=428564 RepID=A0A8D8RKE0_9HEMI